MFRSSFLFLSLGSASAVTLFQTETFDSGTAGFREGGASPNGPVNIGGELSNAADGSGAGGRLLMWNDEPAWTGNYTAAGATAITLNARAVGDDLNLRLAFNGPGGWFFTEGQVLTAGDSASFVNFSLAETSLIYAVASPGSTIFSDTFESVTRFEILSSVNPPSFTSRGNFLRGDNIAATLIIDNLTAVPEPGSVALMATAFLGVFRRRR